MTRSSKLIKKKILCALVIKILVYNFNYPQHQVIILYISTISRKRFSILKRILLNNCCRKFHDIWTEGNIGMTKKNKTTFSASCQEFLYFSWWQSTCIRKNGEYCCRPCFLLSSIDTWDIHIRFIIWITHLKTITLLRLLVLLLLKMNLRSLMIIRRRMNCWDKNEYQQFYISYHLGAITNSTIVSDMGKVI